MVDTGFYSASGQRMTRARNQFQRQALYQRTISDLSEDQRRAEKVARYVGKQKDAHQLVLSDRIEHLYLIEQAIYRENPDLRTFVVTGKLSTRERRDAIQAMRDGYLDVLLATQLADEGLDIVNLNVLHLTFPGRGLEKLQQKVGRIMRTAEGKRGCKVYDYVDDKIPVLRGQAGDRYEWYVGRGCSMSGWAPATAASIKRRMDRIRKNKGRTR
jgi:superfamily II DNA or RNA helicase